MTYGDEIRALIAKQGSGVSLKPVKRKGKTRKGGKGKITIPALAAAVERMKKENLDISDVAKSSGFTEAQLRSKIRRNNWPSPIFGRINPDALADEEKVEWLKNNSLSRLESPWIESKLKVMFRELLDKGIKGIGYEILCQMAIERGIPAHTATVADCWKRVHEKEFPGWGRDVFSILKR